MATAAIEAGDLETALRAITNAVRLALEHRLDAISLLITLAAATLAEAQRRIVDAFALYHAAERERRDTNPQGAATALVKLGRIANTQACYATAIERCRDAAAILARHPHRPLLMELLLVASDALLHQERSREAAWVLGAFDAIREESKLSLRGADMARWAALQGRLRSRDRTVLDATRERLQRSRVPELAVKSEFANLAIE